MVPKQEMVEVQVHERPESNYMILAFPLNVAVIHNATPLANYEDIVANKDLFEATLIDLHKALKTKHM